jgi:hypothetical protein
MSDYRIDDHRVNLVDVLGSWTIAIVVVAVLFMLIAPIGF